MTRSLTSGVKTHLATNEIKPVHLITIGFGTPQNITDCVHDLTSSVSGSSVTYSSSSFLVNIPTYSEETDINKSEFVEFSTLLAENANKIATITTKTDKIRYSAFKNAIAPSAILLPIFCILLSPSSWAVTQVDFQNAYNIANIPDPNT